MILRASGLTKLYGDFLALDDVSLGVAEGEFVSIVGPNGAGKSTLINILTGVTRPSAGSVRVRDQEVAGLSPVRLARLEHVATGLEREDPVGLPRGVQVLPRLDVLSDHRGDLVDRGEPSTAVLRQRVRVALLDEYVADLGAVGK